MNTANYLSTTDYPVTTQGLDFIQNNILCLEQMAAAFGDGNWILSGMTENEEGNLTPGVVALVENSKATVVNFTQGGVSASGLKSKRFRIDSVTNALPQRTYQFLVPDEDGEITNLDRIDIHELAEQIKDNSAAIEVTNSNIATLDTKFNQSIKTWDWCLVKKSYDNILLTPSTYDELYNIAMKKHLKVSLAIIITTTSKIICENVFKIEVTSQRQILITSTKSSTLQSTTLSPSILDEGSIRVSGDIIYVQ